MFNYYIPWIGGETAIKSTIKPLELAYKEYMKTYTGCMRSSLIPLLHAISRFPLLLDKILTESAVALIKAEAQGNLLGKDYREWDSEGCLTDGGHLLDKSGTQLKKQEHESLNPGSIHNK